MIGWLYFGIGQVRSQWKCGTFEWAGASSGSLFGTPIGPIHSFPQDAHRPPSLTQLENKSKKRVFQRGRLTWYDEGPGDGGDEEVVLLQDGGHGDLCGPVSALHHVRAGLLPSCSALHPFYVVVKQVAAEHSEVLIIMFFAKKTFKILKFPVSWTNMSFFKTGNSFSWCLYCSVDVKTTIPVAECVLVHLRLWGQEGSDQEWCRKEPRSCMDKFWYFYTVWWGIQVAL